MICPHCESSQFSILMVAYYCHKCDRVFSALEGTQALIIKRLQEVLRELQKAKAA